jgi:hypothetical protein
MEVGFSGKFGRFAIELSKEPAARVARARRRDPSGRTFVQAISLRSVPYLALIARLMGLRRFDQELMIRIRRACPCELRSVLPDALALGRL